MKAILGIGLACVALIGVMAFVFAADQTAYVTVNAATGLIVDPTSINFGTLTPGQTSSAQETILVPETSNLVVTVSTDMSSIFSNVEIDIGNGFKTIGTETISVSATVNKTIQSRIFIPVAYKSNTYTGTITYTAMEA